MIPPTHPVAISLYPAIIPKAERPPKTKIARNICGRIVPSFMIGSFLHAPESRVHARSCDFLQPKSDDAHALAYVMGLSRADGRQRRVAQEPLAEESLLVTVLHGELRDCLD
jgi:hypothetical protein